MATDTKRKHTEVFVPHNVKEDTDHPNRKGKVRFLQPEEKLCSVPEIVTFPGPLLRADLQKDELMTFIQQKYQECLLQLEDPEQQYSFFFWALMERFLNKDGKVMMAEMGSLLFKSYSLLREKVRPTKQDKNWCLHLARLLCTTKPKDQHREDIIKMGDKYENKGWIYAAHLCYVVAQVDLGSRPGFSLIGCNSLPKDKSAMREVIKKTEVYEYLLSLSSGFGQAHFQESKCVYAHNLAMDGYDYLSLVYLEVIATTILIFPDCVQSTVMKLLVSLSEKVLQGQKPKEPEWLIKLRQLLPVTTEQYSPSNEQIESGFKPEQHLEFDPSVHSVFDSKYTVGKLLGQGGYGSVYAAVRKADQRPVAIKVVSRHPYDDRILMPGEKRKLPREVALTKKVSEAPRSEYVVEFLEWFKTSQIYILVLERPVPCMDLFQFLNHHKRLPEADARKIMWQVVQGIDHCYKRGVFHRDMKLENILINPKSLAVKLIDFGCGELVHDGYYWDFPGTQGYYPPEWVLQGEYRGVPHTVWSLGVVLYEMICGSMAFSDDKELLDGHLEIFPYGSEDCWDLIHSCLQRDPNSRPNFSEILAHKWFKKDSSDSD